MFRHDPVLYDAMSYFARQRPSHRQHLTIIAVTIALLATACGGSEDSNDSTPAAASTAAPEATPVQLLQPDALGDTLAANPEMPLINVHIPYEDHIEGTDAFIAFDSILDSPDLPTDKTAPLALYCRSGNMSAQASATLADAGYTNIIDLDGGMNAWEQSGKPLVDDPTAAD